MSFSNVHEIFSFASVFQFPSMVFSEKNAYIEDLTRVVISYEIYETSNTFWNKMNPCIPNSISYAILSQISLNCPMKFPY